MKTKNIRLSTELAFEYEFGEPKEKGKVISETFYDKKGNTSKHIDYYIHLDNQVIQYEVLYDKNGKDIEWKEFDEQGNFFSNTVRKYDKDGLKTEELFYNSKNELEYKTIYTYKDKKVTEKNKLDVNGNLLERTLNTYDTNGLDTKWITYGTNGLLERKVVLNYNDNGDTTEMLFYRQSGESSRLEMKYDINFNMIEEFHFNKEGKIEQRETWKYYSKGKEQERVIYNEEGKIDIKFDYEYNEEGKLLRIKESDDSGEPNLLTVFEEEYY
jgi:hypothetical protein